MLKDSRFVWNTPAVNSANYGSMAEMGTSIWTQEDDQVDVDSPAKPVRFF